MHSTRITPHISVDPLCILGPKTSLSRNQKNREGSNIPTQHSRARSHSAIGWNTVAGGREDDGRSCGRVAREFSHHSLNSREKNAPRRLDAIARGNEREPLSWDCKTPDGGGTGQGNDALNATRLMKAAADVNFDSPRPNYKLRGNHLHQNGSVVEEKLRHLLEIRNYCATELSRLCDDDQVESRRDNSAIDIHRPCPELFSTCNPATNPAPDCASLQRLAVLRSCVDMMPLHSVEKAMVQRVFIEYDGLLRQSHERNERTAFMADEEKIDDEKDEESEVAMTTSPVNISISSKAEVRQPMPTTSTMAMTATSTPAAAAAAYNVQERINNEKARLKSLMKDKLLIVHERIVSRRQHKEAHQRLANMTDIMTEQRALCDSLYDTLVSVQKEVIKLDEFALLMPSRATELLSKSNVTLEPYAKHKKTQSYEIPDFDSSLMLSVDLWETFKKIVNEAIIQAQNARIKRA